MRVITHILVYLRVRCLDSVCNVRVVHPLRTCNAAVHFNWYCIYVLSSIHRPACELSSIFYSMWVKPVCCVSKISSDCRCQSKEIGISMEVRLLSVGGRGFFLAAS